MDIMKLFTKVRTTFLLVLFSSLGFAQTWTSVASGLPVSNADWIESTVDSNQLYVATTEINASKYDTYLSRWNGINWIKSPKLNSSDFKVFDIAIFGGDVYLVGFNTSNILSYKFDGTNWSSFSPPGFIGYAKTLEVVNGELIFGGDFVANGGIKDLLKYNGTTYSSYPALPTYLLWVQDILEYNGELYISCGDSLSWISEPRSIQKLNSGTSWVQAAHYDFTQGTGVSSNYFEMFSYQGKLFIYESTNAFPRLYKLENDTIYVEGPLLHSISETSIYEGEVYISGMSFNPSKLRYLSKFNGQIISLIVGTPKALSSLAVFDSSLFVFSILDTVFNNVKSKYVFKTKGGFPSIHGNIFIDDNGNCSLDASESSIPHSIIKLSNSINISPNHFGYYSLSIPPGTYKFDTVYFPQKAMKNFSLSCNLPPQFVLALNQTILMDFGVENSIATDMIVDVKAQRGWGSRFGNTEWYYVKISNAGNQTLTSTSLTVQVPPSLNIKNTNPLFSSQVGNNLTFKLLNILPQETKTILIKAEVDTALNNLGDTLTWVSYLAPITGDADLSDNADTLRLRVIGAYDPNDKQASAEFIAPNTKTIDYHIRFQNTGNDTAFKVTVVDTLDLTLPMTNIVINSASHPYAFSVVNNILIWEFDDIMLPDSSVDYFGSQGYVNFTAGINPNVGIGDTINNDADIYFDFQKPVITNVAKTVMITNISVGEERLEKQVLNIYPNPASEVLNIENTSNKAVLFRLTDINGRLILEQSLSAQSVWQYNVNQLQSGIYFLSAGAEGYKIVVTE